MLDRQQSVATVVLDHSECAAVFQRHRIDFCCRGDLSVDAAATAKGVATEELLEELERVILERHGNRESDPRALSTPELVTHIVATHHDYLRRALPMVGALAAKVGRVHGDRNPKLRELAPVVETLVGTLLEHLDEEEETLFPALLGAQDGGAPLEAQLASMTEDHLDVAALLERIRLASDDFTPPEWACTSYRTLFAELAHAERDIFAHVHLENHVLAPRFASR